MGKQFDEQPEHFIKCRFDFDGRWIEPSPLFCSLLGYTELQLSKMTLTDVVHSEDAVELSAQIDKIRSGEINDFDTTLNLVPANGGSVLVYLSGILIRNERGEPGHITCYIQNLSRQKEIVLKLAEREQQFNSLFKNNPHPVYYFDLEGNFEGVNDKLLEFTGYGRNELLQKGFQEFIVEEDLERTIRQFKKAVNGNSSQYEIRVKVKDGLKEVRITKFPRYFGDEVIGVFGILQDITEEKKAKRSLKNSEERWQQLLRQNPQPVQIVQNGKIVYINQAGAEYYKAESMGQLIGKPIMDFVHNDDKEKVLKRKNLLEKNEMIEPAVNKIVLLNGEEKFIEAHSIPIMYNGEPAIQTVVHDITSMKEKQDFIGKSLKEKETLLKEIHHRVKNNLAVISSMLELQIMQSTDESATNALRDSQLRIRSIAMIHEKLYQNESLHNISFDSYLKELVETIRQTYAIQGKKIEISFNLASVSIDINQVIPCSLIVNEVVVNCFKHAFTNIDEGHLNITLFFEDSSVILEIADDGNGLPDDFTVEEQQSLGMTLIQALTDQLEGTFELANAQKGGGTMFRLKFDGIPVP